MADTVPVEGGQQSGDRGQRLPSAAARGSLRGVRVKSATPVRLFRGLCNGLAQALALEREAVGSVHEAIEDGVTGLLAPQDDDAMVAERLATILADAGLAARLGEAGRQRAARQTWATVAQQYLDVYEQTARR